MRTEKLRYEFEGVSNLGTVAEQIERLITLTRMQSQEVARQTATVKAEFEQQTATVKAQLNQQTATVKAELQQQVAAVKAAFNDQTAAMKAEMSQQSAVVKDELQQQSRAHAAELQKQTAAVKAEFNQQTAVVKTELQQQTDALRAEQRQQIAATNQQTAAMRAEFNQQTAAMKAELQQQTAAVKAEFNQQTAQVKAELNQQTIAMKQEGAAQRAELRQIGESGKSLVSTMRDMRTLIGVSFGAYEILQFGVAVIEAKSKIDIFKTGLDQMIGNKREVNELYGEIVRLAKETPFEAEQLFQTTFMLKGMGVETRELIPTLEALGNMAAVAGQDKLPLIAKAFTDVQNKGKLMKQELNQFAENGIPLYDLLAHSLGKTRDEVIKMAEAHEISFAQVKKAIMDASKEGGRYYNLMALQAETLKGQWSNMIDRFFFAKAALGDFYEDGLKKIISGLKETIDQVAGSNLAIERSEKVIQSAVIAYLTYKGVANSAAIAEGLVSAAVTVKNAAVSVGNVIYGAYILTVQRLTQSQNVLNASQTAATTAARGFWAAISANPLGALLLVVGALVTAYYAWDAAHTKVTESISEQEANLQKEQAALKGLVQYTIDSAEGTDRRRKAVELLIEKYPDYFKGLDTEKTSNTDLVRILGNVNRSYEQRIALAREAYKNEKLAAEQRSLLDEELNIMSKLAPEIQARTNGSLQAASDLFTSEKMKYNDIFRIGKPGRFWDDVVSPEDVNRISYRMRQIQTEFANNEVRIQQIKELGKADDLKTEEVKHATIINQLKAAHKSTQEEEKRHKDAVAKIKNDANKNEEGAGQGHADKMKQITLLSANEIKALKLESGTQSYFDQMKLLDAQEKIEIDSINKIKVSRSISEKELQELRAQGLEKIKQTETKYEAERQKLREGFYDSMLKDLSEYVNQEEEAAMAIASANTKSTKQIVAEQKAATKERKKTAEEIADSVQESEKQIQEAHEETTRIQQRQAKQQIGIILELAGQQSGVIGQMAQAIKGVYSNWNIISGQMADEAKTRYDNAQADYVKYMNLFLAGDKQAEASAAKAKATREQASKDMTLAKEATATTVMGLVSMVIQLAQQLYKAMDDLVLGHYKAIADSMGRAKEVMTQFYDFAIEQTKEQMERELEMVEGNYDKRLEIIGSYFDQEKALITDKARMNDILSYSQEMSQALVNAGRDTVWNHKNYVEQMALAEIEIAKNKVLRQQQLEIALAEVAIREAKKTRDEKIAQIDAYVDAFEEKMGAVIDAAKDAADQEIDAVKAASDAKKQFLNDQLDAVKTAYDAQVDAVKSAYDKELTALKEKQSQEEAALRATYELKQLLEQSTSDEVEKIGIIDRARNEALERYRVDEVARLTATRDRILATLTDEGERERVTNEYAQRIQQVHNDVEAAKFDKTKGVSLATTQLRAEEKAEAERLKTEEKEMLTRLETAYQQQFALMAQERDTLLKTMNDQYLSREKELKYKIAFLEEETKSKIEFIQRDLALEITRLQNLVKANEIAAQKEKAKANADYATVAKKAQAAILEAQKQMAIAQIRAEIAILNGKRNILGIGDGRINAAIGELNGAINDIQGISVDGSPVQFSLNDIFNVQPGGINVVGNTGELAKLISQTPVDKATGNIVMFSPRDEKGNAMQLTYNASGKEITVWDEQGNPHQVTYADGYVPATGKYYATGTESVDGQGFPDGVDTVPAWLTKQERVLTVAQNKLLNGISNDELVRRSQLFDGLSGLPMLLGGPMGIEQLLASAQDSRGGSLDLSGLDNTLSAIKEAVASQQHVHVNLDRRGIYASLKTSQGTSDYHSNLFKR